MHRVAAPLVFVLVVAVTFFFGLKKSEEFKVMFGGDSSNPVNPLFTGDSQFQYDTNALPQLQLFADYTVGSSLGPLSNTGKERTANVGTKRFMEPGPITRQQKHISQDNKLFQNEIGQSGRILNPNLVSTGLKLSYEEDEHNSSISSVSEGMTTTLLPAVLPSNNSLKFEIDRQKQELDQYIRVQEENMIKGIRDLHQRQTTSFLTAIEKGLSRKLHEKDYEIENMNRKNRDLEEKIKQAMTEVQTWQVRAKYNESVVNILKNNLQQVMAQNGKEGCGDSEIEDTASCNNQNQNHVGFMDGSAANPNPGKVKMVCRACKVNEVSVLVLPCRHLCVCRDCERFVHVCPVCQVMKTASVEVYMS